MAQALQEITEVLGTVNFSSHKQMREAIEGAMAIAETEIERIKNEPSPVDAIRKIWGLDESQPTPVEQWDVNELIKVWSSLWDRAYGMSKNEFQKYCRDQFTIIKK